MKCPHCGKPISDKLVRQRLGEMTGRKIARERGPEYFRELQAKRKTRAGGRPWPKAKRKKS